MVRSQGRSLASSTWRILSLRHSVIATSLQPSWISEHEYIRSQAALTVDMIDSATRLPKELGVEPAS